MLSEATQARRASTLPPARRWWRESTSSWHLTLLGTTAIGVLVASYASVDPDLYWHRILGQHWLDVRSLNLSEDPISYTQANDWFPTSWLVEIVYALIVDALGYTGILGLRLVLALAFFALLSRYLLTVLPPHLASLLVVAVGWPAALLLQDRPQTFSLVFVAAALPVIHRWLATGEEPGLRRSVAATWLWANVHGLWVLVPAFFVLSAVAHAFHRNGNWRRSALVAALCLAGAAATPVGPKLLLSPLLIRSSTEHIGEWQSTAFDSPVAWGFGTMLVFATLGLAQQKRSQAREVALVLGASVFGFTAYRNAVFASLVLLPAVCTMWAPVVGRLATNVVLPRVVVTATAAASLVLVSMQFLQQSVFPSGAPERMAAHLAGLGTVRVAPTYNWSGYLREFGGDGVRVAIDGRADRYGQDRVDRYGDFMAGQRGWKSYLRRIDPDVLVVERRSALRQLAIAEGWKVQMREHGLVLLTAPRRSAT